MSSHAGETGIAGRPDARPLSLIFGATGYIGSNLVAHLRQTGTRRLRAASRRLEVLEGRDWPDVELIAADALKPATLAAALSGVDTAYYLVHSMGAGKDFGRLDLEAAANFAQAAADAGVSRIIYLGGLAPESASSEHILSRRQTGDELRKGRVPVIELRAGIIVGPGSAAFEVMRDLVLNLPLMITPRWVSRTSPPIALANLLAYLDGVAGIPLEEDLVLDVAGPEYLSYAQMMRILAQEAGCRPPLILPVPLLTPELSARWLHLVTSVPTPIARALIEGLKENYVADDRLARNLVPQELLDFRSSVRETFRAEREHAVAARWTEGALMFRDHRLDYGYYAKHDSGEALAQADPERVWSVVSRVGGSTRYFAHDWLWRLREWLDWMVGGPGRNYGRRDPQDLRIGDRVDSWRVVALEPGRRLTLGFGMRAPGAGVMEFSLHPDGQGATRVRIDNYWHPAGVWGLLYWYATAPFHRLIFRAMADRIARLSEQEAVGGT